MFHDTRSNERTDEMNRLTQKEKLLRTGLSGRLHHWVKDEHAVGLDVNDGHIVASHFVKHKGDLLLNTLAAEAVAPDLSEKELARTIRSFWKKNKLPTRTVCTCLHASSLIARSFSYTNVSPDELPRVLTLEAEEALQLPLEQIALSWHLNPNGNNEISGTLIAAPRRTVQSHIKLMQASGLYPISVEIDCSAVVNLFAFVNTETTPSPVCLINLTAQMAGVVVLSDESAYPRIVFSSNPNGWQDNSTYLIQNIDSALLHYQLRIKGDPVSKLLFTGDPQPDHFMKKIAEDMTLPVEKWNPISDGNVPTSTHLKKTLSTEEMEPFNLAAALGLGLCHPKGEL